MIDKEKPFRKSYNCTFWYHENFSDELYSIYAEIIDQPSSAGFGNKFGDWQHKN